MQKSELRMVEADFVGDHFNCLFDNALYQLFLLKNMTHLFNLSRCKMPLLIDGYNLLRTIQKDGDASSNETPMCRLISCYLCRKKDVGKIIFDGIGPPDKTSLRDIANLEVIFSGKYEADDIIEQLVLENTAPKRLVVVSSDRRVKTAAKKRKAVAIRSDDFWYELVKFLEKKRLSHPEPPGKRDGISKDETDKWLEEFGLG